MQCPFCKEVIQDGAIKCKHCGSMLDQGIANGSSVKTPIPVNTQTDFSLLPGERLLEEGIVTNLHKMTATNCRCYITDQRLVVCGTSGLVAALIGAIMQLLPFLFKATKILYQFNWDQLSGVKKAKHGLATKLVFQTKAGQEHSLALGLNKDKIIAAVGQMTEITQG